MNVQIFAKIHTIYKEPFWEKIFYERNNPCTQRNRIHQGRHHKNVRPCIRNSRRRSMIYRTPEPRLEPSHDALYESEPIYLQDMTDEEIEMMQEEFECAVSDETLNEIYRRLGL